MYFLWPKEMDMATQVQILDKAVCLSPCTNALRKDINPFLLTAGMGKIVGQTGFFSRG